MHARCHPHPNDEFLDLLVNVKFRGLLEHLLNNLVLGVKEITFRAVVQHFDKNLLLHVLHLMKRWHVPDWHSILDQVVLILLALLFSVKPWAQAFEQF